jgi:hypothetical protein
LLSLDISRNPKKGKEKKKKEANIRLDAGQLFAVQHPPFWSELLAAIKIGGYPGFGFWVHSGY